MNDITYPVSKAELEEDAVNIKQKLVAACPLIEWRVDANPSIISGDFTITGFVTVSGQRLFVQKKLYLEEFRLIENWDKMVLDQLAGSLAVRIMIWRPDDE